MSILSLIKYIFTFLLLCFISYGYAVNVVIQFTNLIEKENKTSSDMLALGDMYYSGRGVTKNYQKAFYWFEKSAEQESAGAQHRLGEMYFKGQGVEKNYNKAFHWFKKSAQQGNVSAQNRLGGMYYSGQGVKKSYKKAFHWCEKSAQQGNTDAQLILGMMYANGKGVKRDYQKAIYWYTPLFKAEGLPVCWSLGLDSNMEINYKKIKYWCEKFSKKGDAKAQVFLGSMYSDDEDDGIKKDYKKALYWYEMAAEQGDKDAQYEMGQMYLAGKGVQQNYKSAFKWFKKAGSQGYTEAQHRVAWMYREGKGVKKDHQKAIYWCSKVKFPMNCLGGTYINGEYENDYKQKLYLLERLIEKGDISAQNELAYMYRNGTQIPEDDSKAFQLYKKSAEQGNAEAQRLLGFLYYDGEGILKDYKKAFYWFEKSAKNKTSKTSIRFTFRRLGSMYFKGQGVKKNYKKALYWHKKYENSEDLQIGDTQYAFGSYYSSIGDNRRAFYWYQKAAKEGDPRVQIIFDLYPKNNGFKLNHIEVVTVFNLARGGWSIDQFGLGSMYYNGEKVKKNYKKALYWYDRSAKQGLDLAQFALGNMYYLGQGVARNYVQAYKWFSLYKSQMTSEAKKVDQLFNILESQMTKGQIAEAQKLARQFQAQKETN